MSLSQYKKLVKELGIYKENIFDNFINDYSIMTTRHVVVFEESTTVKGIPASILDVIISRDSLFKVKSLTDCRFEFSYSQSNFEYIVTLEGVNLIDKLDLFDLVA